jgi:hypothetical protein
MAFLHQLEQELQRGKSEEREESKDRKRREKRVLGALQVEQNRLPFLPGPGAHRQDREQPKKGMRAARHTQLSETDKVSSTFKDTPSSLSPANRHTHLSSYAYAPFLGLAFSFFSLQIFAAVEPVKTTRAKRTIDLTPTVIGMGYKLTE